MKFMCVRACVHACMVAVKSSSLLDPH